MIAENTAADPSAGVNAQIVGWDFYEAGAPDTSQGLPANGLLTSALGGTQFQFASYTADNAPVVTSGQSATLTLADLQKLANLDILDSSQNSRYTWSVRLNFANATSLTFSGNYDPDRTLSSDRVAAAEVGLIHDTATWSGSDPCSNPTHLYEWGSIGSLSGPHRDRVFAAAESKM